MTKPPRNWAGNLAYRSKTIHRPASVEEVCELVSRSSQLKALGTRHCFNAIADTDADHVSLEKLNRVVGLDRDNLSVTVEAGIRYGELGAFLHREGHALHNLASLPHISVVGACATATHGSGENNGNLAMAVVGLEMVTADGNVVQLVRGRDEAFAGAVVGLGALGVVTKLTLAIEPTFDVRQNVFEGLPLSELEANFDAIESSGYSVSLFTDWTGERFHQVWLKQRVDHGTDAPTPEFFGAIPADADRHPLPGHSAENCTAQMGVSGPWHERLPHFRLEFTPSSGEELQSEYYVSRQHACDALCAINEIRERIAPHVFVTEVRAIAPDDLWMSPCYNQASVAIHFTWKPEWPAVKELLPEIENQLAPFNPRPHWGKLFTMPPEQVRAGYERFDDFRALVLRFDSKGKFRNAFLDEYLMLEV